MRANTVTRLECGRKEGLLGALYSGWECLGGENVVWEYQMGKAGQDRPGLAGKERGCAKLPWEVTAQGMSRIHKGWMAVLGRRDHAGKNQTCSRSHRSLSS